MISVGLKAGKLYADCPCIYYTTFSHLTIVFKLLITKHLYNLQIKILYTYTGVLTECLEVLKTKIAPIQIHVKMSFNFKMSRAQD